MPVVTPPSDVAGDLSSKSGKRDITPRSAAIARGAAPVQNECLKRRRARPLAVPSGIASQAAIKR
jgi:hypothetical protein